MSLVIRLKAEVIDIQVFHNDLTTGPIIRYLMTLFTQF